MALGTFGTLLANAEFVQEFLRNNIETAGPVLTLVLAGTIAVFRFITSEPVSLTGK